MNDFKISVEVSLSEATVASLKEIANTIVAAIAVNNNPDLLKKAVERAETKEEPLAVVPPMVDDIVPPADTIGDLPVSAADLRQVVKEAKERGVAPSVIKGVFAEFGIKASSECPEERMEELYNRIQVL